jgi:hypothetical protein
MQREVLSSWRSVPNAFHAEPNEDWTAPGRIVRRNLIGGYMLSGVARALSEQAADTAEEDRRVIELLRTPGLSIKYLDDETKERIRGFIRRTHVEKGVSLGDVAKLIGNKTSGYTSWLTRQLGIQARPFEESRLKAIREKCRKYERKPFDGTEGDKGTFWA